MLSCTLIDSKDKFCPYTLSSKLAELITGIDKRYGRICVLCIGTDSCTGDSYGPLVGLLLSKYSLFDFDLYGTIYNPVHANNLEETLTRIDKENTLIIAVDSSLGHYDAIGCIKVGSSPIKPGSGVGKALPEVGDIHIEGIVNINGLLPIAVLQSTRLSLVYSMAEITARAIQHAFYKCKLKRISITQSYIR